MSNERNRITIEVFSPAEYLNDELDARGWDRDTLAHNMVRRGEWTERLLAGEIHIDRYVAENLGKALGRRCLMIEIELKYVEIAANRLRQEVLAL